MKKLILIALTALLFSTLVNSQPITYAWTSAMGGITNNNQKIYIDKDSQGNVYVSGTFSGTHDFGALTLTALGSSDMFVAKYNSSGSCLWAIRGGANFSLAVAGGIAVSGNNIYVTGSYSNLLSIGSFTVNSQLPYKDIFIASLNTADGTCNWLEKAGGANDDFATNIAAATGGGFYICGSFTDAATFCTTTLNTTSVFDVDVFYAKYSSSGTCVWAKQLGGFGSEGAGDIKEISPNEIVMTGDYESSMTLSNGTTLNSVGSSDYFLIKLNVLGDVVWAVSGGSANTDAGYALDTDSFGNIYSTGIIGGNATFGTVSIVNNQNLNMFTTKHNSSGVCQWINMAGGISDDMGLDIAADPLGSCYTTGYVSNNPNFGSTTLPGVQGKDSYVVKYNTSGGLVWLAKIGSAGNDRGKAIIYDFTGSCYTAGDFDASLTLGSNPPITPSANGVFATYLTRISGGTVGLTDEQNNSFSFFPNPATNEIHLNLEKITDLIFTVDIIDVSGHVVKSVKLSQQDALQSYSINLKGLASGSYFLRVNSSSGDFSKLFIIQSMK